MYTETTTEEKTFCGCGCFNFRESHSVPSWDVCSSVAVGNYSQLCRCCMKILLGVAHFLQAACSLWINLSATGILLFCTFILQRGFWCWISKDECLPFGDKESPWNDCGTTQMDNVMPNPLDSEAFAFIPPEFADECFEYFCFNLVHGVSVLGCYIFLSLVVPKTVWCPPTPYHSSC